MQSAQSVLILPASLQNTANSYVINDTNHQNSNNSNNSINNSTALPNNKSIQSLIILSGNTSGSCQPLNVSNINSIVKNPAKPKPLVKRQQPIKPKIKQLETDDSVDTKQSLLPLINKSISINEAITVPQRASKKRAAPKAKKNVSNEKISNESSLPIKKITKKSYKRVKRETKESSLLADSEINIKIESVNNSYKIINSSTSNNYRESLYSSSRVKSQPKINNQSVLPKTSFSKSLFDSIEYLSSTWTNIFKTGNDTEQEYLNLFRQFHCADCLNSFRKQQADKQISDNLPKNSELLKNKSGHQSLKSTANSKKQNKIGSERLQMNTPPPPLLPITDEARNGLFHYFGQQNQQYQVTSQNQQQQQQTLNGFINVNAQLGNGPSQNINDMSELTLMPNLTQIGSNLQNSIIQQKSIRLSDPNSSGFTFMPSNVEMMDSSVNNSNNFTMDHSSIQEKGQSLSRKLAQRRPKHELIECGILPRSRISMLHHNRMVDLKKAQLQDILKTKIEKRPNRDTLIQKNILPDSAPHAAPSLIRKCTELKRARLADDLNDKLAKRPGPLELVESGILVSSDSALTDAIKGGKIQYPRTATYIQQLEQQVSYDQNFFNLDDSNLNCLNFNFNNLTDNDDSNSSSSTTKTNNTLASNSSITNSFNPIGNNNVNSNNILQTNQTSPQSTSILSQNEIINFNDLFPTNVPSPAAASPGNLTISKMSPSSPYTPSTQQTYDFMPNSQTKPILKSQVSKNNKSKSFSSNSSVTSNSSNSSKTNRSSRTNSQSSNGPGSNASSSSSSTKKLSQLIFHEYRGPNQKSSKSSISLKTNISLKKNSNNLINAFNFQKSNLVVNNSNSNNSNSTNTNEIFFDDSNDSSNNLNSAIMNIGSVSEALNPHKIRIKQQKIFLKYNSSKSRDSSNGENVGDIQVSNSENPSVTTEQNPPEIMNIPSTNQIFNGNKQNQLNMLQQQSILPIETCNSNHHQQQSIHLLPLNNIQMLGNIQNIFQTNYTPVSIASFDNMNKNIENVGDNLKNEPTSSNSRNPSSDSNGFALSSLNQQQQVKINSKVSNNFSQHGLTPKIESMETPTVAKTNGIDEMNLNELKEECRRRKLLVTGNKQKLIDRIKSNISSMQASGIKSPDSGVNLDSSPSIISNDQSPKNNSSLASASQSSNYGSKSSKGLTNNQKAVATKDSQASSTQQNSQNKQPKTTSNLDDFFNFLDIENLGASPAATETAKDKQSQSVNNEPSSEKPNGDNLSETKATLEISLKNSAELLKQLSSIGQIEHMHQLENQMKESMQLIEKLKSASSQQENGAESLEFNSNVSHQGIQKHLTSPSFFETINNYPNKLRTNTSIPANLNKHGDTQHLNGQYFVQNNGNIQYASQAQLTDPNIPINKSNFQNDFNNISHNASKKTEAVYQFDNLMKELNNDINTQITFTCNSPQDDENSNETDLIRSKKALEQQKTLPSIGSLITQDQSQISDNHKSNSQQCMISQDMKLNQNFTQGTDHNHNEMEWNDTEFLKLCEDLDDPGNLFEKIEPKPIQIKQGPNDFNISGQFQNSYSFSNLNTNGNLQQDISQPQSNIFLNSTNQLALSNDQNSLNFGPQMQEHGNVGTDQFVSHQVTHSLINSGDINGSDNNGNMLMPWEFDGELNNIANYLQSPIV